MNSEQPAQQVTPNGDDDIDVDEYLSEDLPTDFSEQAACTSLAEEQPQTQSSPVTRSALSPPAEVTALLGPGSVLRERFVLQSRAGGGNMGQVYKALDRRREEAGDPGPWVAVKLVQPAPEQHPQAREALQQEAQIGQRLTHPNIVRIFDVDRDGECSFLVMEWLEGDSLARFLDSRRWRPLPRLQALQIVEGICRALAYAHGQGIVHADVKPGNIFLSADGSSKLLDFGVAQLTNGETGETLPALVRGHTPEYASPEVIKGEAPTAADDLFSLACVAYRMLAGKRAFGKLNALEAETAGQRPARIEHLPLPQWRALDEALTFRRADRPADVNTFIASLKGPRDEAATATIDRVPEDTPEATAEELALEVAHAENSSRRNTFRWATAAGVVLALALMLAVTMRQPASLPAATPGASVPVASAELPLPLPVEPEEAMAMLTDLALPVGLPLTSEQPDATFELPAGPAMYPWTVPPGMVDPDMFQVLPVNAGPGEPDVIPRTGDPAGSGTMDSPSPAAEPDLFAALPPPVPVAASVVVIPRVTMAELRFRRYAEPRFFQEGLPTVSGWVDVSFAVDTDGNTTDVTVLGAEPGGYWADAAAEAVRRWRFQPVARAGEVVAVRSEVRLRFAPDLVPPAAQQAAN